MQPLGEAIRVQEQADIVPNGESLPTAVAASSTSSLQSRRTASTDSNQVDYPRLGAAGKIVIGPAVALSDAQPINGGGLKEHSSSHPAAHRDDCGLA